MRWIVGWILAFATAAAFSTAVIVVAGLTTLVRYRRGAASVANDAEFGDEVAVSCLPRGNPYQMQLAMTHT